MEDGEEVTSTSETKVRAESPDLKEALKQSLVEPPDDETLGDDFHLKTCAKVNGDANEQVPDSLVSGVNSEAPPDDALVTSTETLSLNSDKDGAESSSSRSEVFSTNCVDGPTPEKPLPSLPVDNSKPFNKETDISGKRRSSFDSKKVKPQLKLDSKSTVFRSKPSSSGGEKKMEPIRLGEKAAKGGKRKREESPDSADPLEKFTIQYKGFKQRPSDRKKVKRQALKCNPFNPANRKELPRYVSPRPTVPDEFDQSSLQPEYAQYLGLQPIVKFKCSECGLSSFQSMSALNSHKIECRKGKGPPPAVPPVPAPEPKSANIKLTRKVFLCSACGTYYENWNLFLHMREAHRRYICLTCLGMFSVPEKLAEHMKTKHGVVSQDLETTDQITQHFHQSFYLLCLHCDKVFSEEDKIVGHKCNRKKVAEDVTCRNVEPSDLDPPEPNPPEAATPSRKPRDSIRKSQKAVKESRKEVEPTPETNPIEDPVPLEVPPEVPPTEGTSDEPRIEPDAPLAPDPIQEDCTQEAFPQLEPVSNPILEPIPLPPIPPPLPPSPLLTQPKSARKPRRPPKRPTRRKKPTKKQTVPPLSISLSSIVDPVPSPPPVENNIPEPVDSVPIVEEPIVPQPKPDPVHDFTLNPLTLSKNILKLKLQQDMDSDSDDSQKLSLVVDESANNSGSESKTTDVQEPFNMPVEENQIKSEVEEKSSEIPLAGEDVAAMALTLDDKIENVPIQAVLKECVRTSCISCNYCRHAVKIAVNGKYLALHLLSEHRYTPIKNETSEDVVNKLKGSLDALENMFFNAETYDSCDASIHVPFDLDTSFDCLQCSYVCSTHKDLYAHKKKSHTKSLLLCIMCKSNFYSYSELICHLCPGHYNAEVMFHNVDISFRCCFCRFDAIPSAFRLMVHLRKSHHTCDICLEICTDQQKLSTHLWKHKMNHLCYRCGIAYASKPDITKHLFWKHGHESVLCKKCLQKKWPHVYHFCIPPTSFLCEECNASFSKAVALKVHKRIHGNDYPYACSQCDKKFVSKKLLIRHEERHSNIENGVPEVVPVEEDQKEEVINVTDVVDPTEEASSEPMENKETEIKDKAHKKHKKDKKDKKVVDVYDLPPLNLSSESDSSDEDDKPSEKPSESENDVNSSEPVQPKEEPMSDPATMEENQGPIPIIDIVEEMKRSPPSDQPSTEPLPESPLEVTNGPQPEELEPVPNDGEIMSSAPDPVANAEGIWENFYKTNPQNVNLPYPLCAMKSEVAYGIIMGDHDYCTQFKADPIVIKEDIPTTSNLESNLVDDLNELNGLSEKEERLLGGVVASAQLPEDKKKTRTPKKKKEGNESSSSSDSSSESDSSSCSCGTNCSCSSSSSNSSSSSSSDSESSSAETKPDRRKKKKERRSKNKSETENVTKEEDPAAQAEFEVSRLPVDPPIQESELDTDETTTDEEFYDRQPQRIANQLLAEKRNQLMLLASVAPVNNGTVPSPHPEPEPTPTQLEAPPPQIPLPSTSTPKMKMKVKKKKKVAPPRPRVDKPKTPHRPPPHYAAPPKSFYTPPPEPPHLPLNSTPVPISDNSNENDKSRSSKRRRIPNKFYGYSSGEEEERQGIKQKKPEPVPPITIPAKIPPPQPPLTVPRLQLTVPKQVIRKPSYLKSPKTPKILPIPGTAEAPPLEQLPPPPPRNFFPPPPSDSANPNRTEKDVYCYCRCPYDEVSEMIACDDENCPIEWFHFECVGILVPPRGQWYCPGCRRSRGLPI